MPMPTKRHGRSFARAFRRSGSDQSELPAVDDDVVLFEERGRGCRARRRSAFRRGSAARCAVGAPASRRATSSLRDCRSSPLWERRGGLCFAFALSRSRPATLNPWFAKCAREVRAHHAEAHHCDVVELSHERSPKRESVTIVRPARPTREREKATRGASAERCACPRQWRRGTWCFAVASTRRVSVMRSGGGFRRGGDVDRRLPGLTPGETGKERGDVPRSSPMPSSVTSSSPCSCCADLLFDA